MNVLRSHSQRAARPLWRAFASAVTTRKRPFIPPTSIEEMDMAEEHDKFTTMPLPTSKHFFTARSAYYDCVDNLERASHMVRTRLTNDHLLPLPQFAADSLSTVPTAWKDKTEVASALGTRLSAKRFRRIKDLLNELRLYQRIAITAQHSELQNGLEAVLSIFEVENKQAFLARGKRKATVLDELGRSYTLGKRKTSAARVWVIASQHAMESRGLREFVGTPPETQIIVNNVPLHKYFTLPRDRERILRPFRLAGLIGAYNVFALVRGGGTTGQSGALTHGIAKGLAVHVPEVETILRKSKLLRRDPRMVERKKPGRAKARKRYQWVKR